MAENSLLQRLDGLVSRFEEVGTLITDPAVIADMKRFVKLNKEYRDLEKIVASRAQYVQTLNGIAEARELLEQESDPEMREMAKEELEACSSRLPELEEEIKLLLVPADPQDDKNAIVEIRGGTGGDEAALFAGDLYRMYVKYCEAKGWKVAVSSFSEGAAGGFKEIIFTVSGEKADGILKYESGVHRVQRVPATETQGRVHTSAATVAVLPEADEFDVEINEGDIKWDTFRSGGDGVQNVNKVARAQEQGAGLDTFAFVHLRQGTSEVSRRDCKQAQDHGFDGRPFGQDPHLQLSAGTYHGPSHQLYDL